MTSSRDRLLGFALAAALLASPAAAQTTDSPVSPPNASQTPQNAPEALAPPQPIVPPPLSERPIVLGPALATPAAPAPRAPSAPTDETPAAPAQDEGIETSALQTLDPGAVGLLTDESGGLGLTMWAGTDRRVIATMLGRLALANPSPTLQDLTRRLLLTAAALPEEAKGGENGPASSDDSLLRLRLERLAAGGQLADLLALLDRVPPENDDLKIARLSVDARLLSGDLKGACATARAANSRSGERYWLKVIAYCRALDDDVSGASLAIELLQEEGVQDPVFFALMDAVLAGDTSPDKLGLKPRVNPVDSLPEPTPLAFSMLRTTGFAIPVDALLTADPLMLHAIATTPNLALTLRLEAAHEAARVGALDAATLAQIYAAIPFSDAERRDALLLAEANIGAKAPALLYQLAHNTPDDAERAKYLAAALRLARRNGEFILAARVNVAALKALTPAPDRFDVAAEVARALLAAGEGQAARDWYELARQSAAQNGDLTATRVLLDLWPLMQISDAGGPLAWSDGVLDLWWKAQRGLPAETRFARARLLSSLLEGLGKPVPAAFWTTLLAGPAHVSATLPSAPVWRAMVAAANAGRRGEGVLMGLAALGDTPLEKVNPVVIAAVAHSLAALQLTNEARALAVEAAIDAGL